MPSLVHFALDPFSRRLRLMLAEYGVPVELIDEQPWEPSPDIYELNPAGTLPVYLEDAATPLCGIEAISEYLEETKSSRIRLLGLVLLPRPRPARLLGDERRLDRPGRRRNRSWTETGHIPIIG